MRITILLLAAVLTAAGAAAQPGPGDAQYAAAAALAADGRHEEAAAALERFLAGHAGHPRATQARLLLGAALTALEKPAPAAKAYEAVLEQKPPPDVRAEALVGLGRARLALRQESALEPLTEAFGLTRQDPRLGPPASMLLGEALLAAGRHAEAVRAFDRLSQWPAHAEAPRAHFMIGEAHRLAGAHGEAAVTFRSMAEKHWRHPLAPRAALSAGDAFLAVEKLDDAEAEYRRVLKVHLESPAAPKAQLGLGRVAFQRGAYAVARAAYQAAALVFAAAGIAPEAELRVADCYLAEKNREEAGRRYSALADSPDREVRSEARYSLARMRLAAGELGPAAEAFLKLAEDGDAGRWAHLARLRAAEIRAGAGEHALAAALLRPVAAGAPETAIRDEGAFALGAALVQAGDYAGAGTELDAVVRRSPSGPFADRAAALAARCRLEQRDAAGAESRAAALLKRMLDPEIRADALTTLGKAQLLLGQAAGAAVLRGVLADHASAAAAPLAARALLVHYRDARMEAQAAEIERLIGERYAAAAAAEDAPLAEAMRQLEAARYADAERLLGQVLALRPDRSRRIQALAGLAEAAAAQARPADADRQLAALVADAPSAAFLAGTRYRVARAHLRAGSSEQALAALQAALPGADAALAPRVLVETGRLLSEDRPAEAEPLLRAVLERHAGSEAVPEALYALAWCAIARGAPGEAQPYFERLLSGFGAHPLAADAAFRLGEVEFRAGRYAAAAERYRKAVESGFAVAEQAGYKLGWALRRQKDHAGAARAFAAVAERRPEGPLALESLVRAGEAGLELERYEAALGHFRAALERGTPGEEGQMLRAQARVGAAAAHLFLGEFDRARELAAEAAAPANGWYGGRAQLVRAEAVFQKEGPKAAAGEFALAAALFARYRDIAAEAQFRVGECLEGAGNARGAAAAWQRVLELYPDTDWAGRSRDRLTAPSRAGARVPG